MRRSSLLIFSRLSQGFSSSAAAAVPPSDVPVLYSFLQPTVFPLRGKTPPVPPPPFGKVSETSAPPRSPCADKETLESDLKEHLRNNQTDEAWRSFKALTAGSLLPSRQASNSLIAHLSSLRDLHNLKRAFASAIFLLENAPRSLELETLDALFRSLDAANAAAPAFALVKSMFKNRCFAPFHAWGEVLLRLARKNGAFDKFLIIFEENCRIAMAERITSMKPDLGACNETLEGCCRELGSVADAERILEIMSAMDVRQDSRTFGALAYLYASKGLNNRIIELEKLISGVGISDRTVIYSNLVRGYLKSGDFESTMEIILRALKEQQGENGGGLAGVLDEESYCEVVKSFVEKGRMKDLADLIIESQKLESSSSSSTDNYGDTVGYRIVSACVNLGLMDKAHSILDEMNACGGPVGLGVYSSILKAYCKERRTAEAAQLVAEISGAGLRLDAGSYDALIDAAMSGQDFQSALSLFRDMREAQLSDLKVSYLTIMTGLMENQRPELMAAFLDSVVDDPRVEIATHDWNSIIHAFCKIGRLEDARRTYRRMIFLQFEPSEQTYLSLVNGYVSAEKYFSVLILWSEVRKKGANLGHDSLDGFLYALVKGGFFDAAMQVVEMAQDLKIFVDKWRHKQAFMENHKKLRVAKLRKRNFRKMEALVAFKNWAGLN
ncbi:unnamed protein product [Spirodela intermedia]|uniref:At1g68980-like TPR repeats domain-containing protein n=1 Tax=Spirodela intermedia TaxID=51605 RepID=A0A7I8JX22_SPIIN|nr:unnamed protein product [Spirodela intermedia]